MESSPSDRQPADNVDCRALLEDLADVVLMLDPAGAFRYVTPSITALTGHTPAELIGTRIWDYIHEDDVAMLQSRMADRLAGITDGGEYSEARVRHRDGEWCLVELRSARAGGEADALIVTARDMTLARSAQQRYLDVVRSVDAVVWELDVEAQRFTFVSHGLTRLLGYDPAEFLADAGLWERIVHEDDRPRIQSLRSEPRDHEHFEYRVVRRDGDVIWLRDEIRLETDWQGRPLLRGVAVDITDLRQAQDGLRRSVDSYFSLFDDFPTLVWRTGPDGEADYFNRAWLEFSGRTLDEERGSGWLDGIHPEDRPEVVRQWRLAFQQRVPFSMEYRLRHHSGDYRPVLDVGRPYRDPDGNYVGYAGSGFDLTAQRALEQQLRQVQKIEAVGQLAGGIAHDFNNILLAIRGHAELALQSLDLTDDAHGEVEEICRAAERAAGLTRQLLAFSRKQVLQPRVFELSSVVREMGEMLRRLIAENIELRFDCSPEGTRVFADPGQIEQVLLNLVVNARDAMPGGGSLAVRVDRTQLDASSHPLLTFIPPGEYVRLTVEDTGVGMDEATLNRIFEPFFTTKEPGRGTGLGLAMAYGIVKQSDGFILAESEPGRGARFEVLLHRVDRPAETATAPGSSGGMAGTERILVVEDDAAVRRLIARTLTMKGYRVLEAADADEATHLFETAAARPRLLLSDVVLPRTSGTEIARQLVGRMPDLRVLLMSGFPRDNFPGGVPAEWAFMEKPFTPGDLLIRVREILDRA